MLHTISINISFKYDVSNRMVDLNRIIGFQLGANGIWKTCFGLRRIRVTVLTSLFQGKCKFRGLFRPWRIVVGEKRSSLQNQSISSPTYNFTDCR